MGYNRYLKFMINLIFTNKKLKIRHKELILRYYKYKMNSIYKSFIKILFTNTILFLLLVYIKQKEIYCLPIIFVNIIENIITVIIISQILFAVDATRYYFYKKRCEVCDVIYDSYYYNHCCPCQKVYRSYLGDGTGRGYFYNHCCICNNEYDKESRHVCF